MYIFIYDDLMLKNIQDKMRLPMEFVSFACIDGWKMYSYKRRPIIVEKDFVRRCRGNDKVYGSIWKLKEPFFFLRIVDAFYACSKSRIYENSPLDRMHRVTINTYPFYIESIDELVQQNFYTFQPIKCEVWVANQKDERIETRIRQNRHKVQNGCILSYIEKCIKDVNKTNET